ncbi:MAG: DUF695 domain-containing protein [Bacteroidales bacterium]
MREVEKNWFVSTSELEGQEIITRGRRDLKEIQESGKYPERIEIEWEYKPISNAGMPTEEQDKFMNEIAFKLSDAEEKEGIGYMTATHTGRSRFFMVFYTSDIEKFAMILHKVLDEYEQLPLQIGRIEDPEWVEYKEMLRNNGIVE